MILQNDTAHAYEYDNLGRLLHDRITILGENVDGAVRRISTIYDAIGNVKNVTSYDVNDVVLNEIMYEYGDNQKLAKLYQSQDGAVNIATTPCVEYNYAGVVDSLRLETMTYPSGKTLTYDYDTYNNVSTINEGNVPLVSYTRSGSGSVVQTSYNEPGVSLDDANGLDRFGRIVDHAWKNGTTDVVRIQHDYDRVGNRTNRTDVVCAANSEVYTYDGVNQIKSLNRGSSAFTEMWDYDGTGNWLTYNKDGAVENRTHNAANEIQGTCTHDSNGNMTIMPGYMGKYDAWNRLVEARDSSDTLIARYDYNGANQRIKKTVGTTVTKSFFNEAWQELEISEPQSSDCVCIWGLRYIDDLVLCEKGAERLYSLADPNWNMVAVVDSAGVVQERMKYDAFGKITWLDASFAVKANSAYAWNRTFTGQVFDGETGLMLYRNRYYHTGLGRFLQRDPIGYRAWDVSLYRYVKNTPQFSTDSFGLILDTCKKNKCCEDSQAAGEAEAKKAGKEPPMLAGSVVCCDGEKVVCLYGIPGPGETLEPNPDPKNFAHLAKLICLIVHEFVHTTHTVCTPGIEGYSAPTSTGNISQESLGTANPYECDAYRASLTCIAAAKPGCRGDKDCEKSIQDEIDRQEDNIREYCRPWNQA